MPYVEVEVDLDDFRIDDLIEHVEDAGYIVLDRDDGLAGSFLSDDELNYLIELTRNSRIGTTGYFAYEKLKEFIYELIIFKFKKMIAWT